MLLNLQLPIHKDLPDVALQRLKSRSAPLVLAEQLRADNFNTHDKWIEYWETSMPAHLNHNGDPTACMTGMESPRHVWKALNRIRTSHGVCRDSLHRWGMADSPSCDCGAPSQTIQHITRSTISRGRTRKLARKRVITRAEEPLQLHQRKYFFDCYGLRSS
nr:unnamed protein product [Callosobruchus analis]